MSTLLTFMTKLKKYSVEQEYRINMIKEAKSEGLKVVHLPVLTEKMPYRYYDVEETNAFGYRTYYASFFGVNKVIFDKKFNYCYGKICGVSDIDKKKMRHFLQ